LAFNICYNHGVKNNGLPEPKTPAEVKAQAELRKRWEWEHAGTLVAFSALFMMFALAIAVFPPVKH